LASISIPRQAAPETGLEWQAVGIAERVASGVLLVALSPVIVASAVAVAALSRSTPFIAHRRVGWRGKPLWMLKLRTMWNDGASSRGHRRGWVEYIEDGAGPQHKQADDARVNSRFARFCRRHSIDELPQLWHVVRGQMALVGPRPVTGEELRRYYGADADEVLRLKPGVAGLWQVSGRSRLTYAERRELDLRLVRSRSLAMYGEVLIKTLGEVLSGRNSW